MIKSTPWPESASELYRPSDHHLLANLMPTFVKRGVSRSQHGGSPMAVISVFKTGAAIFFFQEAPQLYSRGWVDPIPNSSENLVAQGIGPGPMDL
jgi:hypothetical protein